MLEVERMAYRHYGVIVEGIQLVNCIRGCSMLEFDALQMRKLPVQANQRVYAIRLAALRCALK